MKGQQRLADTSCVISGTVAAEKPTGAPLVVLLVARGATGYVVIDYFTAAVCTDGRGVTAMSGYVAGMYFRRTMP